MHVCGICVACGGGGAVVVRAPNVRDSRRFACDKTAITVCVIAARGRVPRRGKRSGGFHNATGTLEHLPLERQHAYVQANAPTSTRARRADVRDLCER